jgi:hypothetical protein
LPLRPIANRRANVGKYPAANEAEGTGAHIHRRRIAGERTCVTSRTTRKHRRDIRRDPLSHGCTSVEQPTERFAADIEEAKQ